MVSARFITYEGLDGAGKTTHLQRSSEWLLERGIAHTRTHEPGGTPVGEAIRRAFLDDTYELAPETEFLLLNASRIENVRSVIRPSLERGNHVLCDRFVDATRAYQGHGRYHGDPARLKLIERLHKEFVGLEPDLTLLFDIDDATFLKRREKIAPDRIEQENLEFCLRVRNGYRALAEQYPERIHIIDSSERRAKAETQEEVRDILTRYLGL